jgi:hypothetical protein
MARRIVRNYDIKLAVTIDTTCIAADPHSNITALCVYAIGLIAVLIRESNRPFEVVSSLHIRHQSTASYSYSQLQIPKARTSTI